MVVKLSIVIIYQKERLSMRGMPPRGQSNAATCQNAACTAWLTGACHFPPQHLSQSERYTVVFILKVSHMTMQTAVLSVSAGLSTFCVVQQLGRHRAPQKVFAAPSLAIRATKISTKIFAQALDGTFPSDCSL